MERWKSIQRVFYLAFSASLSLRFSLLPSLSLALSPPLYLFAVALLIYSPRFCCYFAVIVICLHLLKAKSKRYERAEKPTALCISMAYNGKKRKTQRTAIHCLFANELKNVYGQTSWCVLPYVIHRLNFD